MDKVEKLRRILVGVVWFLLIAAVLAAAGLVIHLYVGERRAYQEYANSLNRGIYEQQAAQNELRRQQEADDSFYQRLADGLDVDVLIVGDSIGACAGASSEDTAWVSLLRTELSARYGVRVSVTNVSLSGNTSYAGWAQTAALEDGVQYDLAIVCYGQNDAQENFSLYYESILRQLRLRFEKCSVISILESSQRDYTPKMQTIQSLCAHYGIPAADTVAPFQSGYDRLTNDGLHPNDDGQAIYCEVVLALIEENVAAYADFDAAAVAPVNDAVTAFDAVRRIPAADFVREDSLTYTLRGAGSGLLGADFSYFQGDNLLEAWADGELAGTIARTIDDDVASRRIMVLSEDTAWEQELRLVFASAEQADSFAGVFLSGALPQPEETTGADAGESASEASSDISSEASSEPSPESPSESSPPSGESP